MEGYWGDAPHGVSWLSWILSPTVPDIIQNGGDFYIPIYTYMPDLGAVVFWFYDVGELV